VSEQFDVVVLGMGPGGEVAASQLLTAGRRVAVVERELIGGECAYWGCIPSKTLLRPPDARAEAERAAGLSRPELQWPDLRGYRDYMIRNSMTPTRCRGTPTRALRSSRPPVGSSDAQAKDSSRWTPVGGS